MSIKGFEYKQVDFSSLNSKARQDLLVSMGLNGWELVAIYTTGLIFTSVTAIFKKPL